MDSSSYSRIPTPDGKFIVILLAIAIAVGAGLTALIIWIWSII